jgi:hypothetical protein
MAGSVKAPKILADIIDTIVDAVDVDFDLKRLWEACMVIFSPISICLLINSSDKDVNMPYHIISKGTC